MKKFTQDNVMFDLDGTLVDTRAAVTECYRRVFRQHLDSAFPPAEVPGHDIFAMRPRELFARVAPAKTEQLFAAYRATYPDCTDLIAVFPGVVDLIAALVRSGRKPSLVTNKGLERTLIDLGVAGIPRESFVAIVTAEDTIERKPDPAPIKLGLVRAAAVAADAVYVGDGPQDVIAAHASGMPVIAVSYGFYDAATLAGHNPDALVGSVAELARRLDVALVGAAE